LQVRGENGKGVASRWYPKTLAMRIQAIEMCMNRIAFSQTDGVARLESWLAAEQHGAVFIDPPYTAGGKRAGSRLYAHSNLDHARVFELLAQSSAPFLMTYDCAPEVRTLVRRFGFSAVHVTMKNTHHDRIGELVITRGPPYFLELPQ
jgi:DNA adenine methylase